MLKSLLQKLMDLTAKKGADGSFPNFDGQLYGSGNQANFTYIAPSDGDFVIIPQMQRAVSYELHIETASNDILASYFSTDEQENTKRYTSFARMNKGDKAVFKVNGGTMVNVMWRFFPAKL
jgi:hypothetical protein